MATGLSLHVGVNQADNNIFPTVSELMGPEKDADDMGSLATSHGFTAEVLKGAQATYFAVEGKLQSAAQALYAGDIFLFTFAGHGSAHTDLDSDESDNLDEAMLLFDRMMFDDDLRLNIWPNFRSGVRILMVADSCHAGTVMARMVPSTLPRKCPGDVTSSIALETSFIKTKGGERRKISRAARQEHLEKFRDFYEAITVPLLAPPIAASVLLLAACGDLQTAADGPNGAFTAALLKVVQNGGPTDYQDLINKIAVELASISQIPVLTPGEPPDPAFIGQAPFTI